MGLESRVTSYRHSVRDAHPDPMLTARIPKPRSRFGAQIPAWPAAMIDPSDVELARWTELWRQPQALAWVHNNQERSVAALVRLEQRCRQNRQPTAAHRAELEQLRNDLGLQL